MPSDCEWRLRKKSRASIEDAKSKILSLSALIAKNYTMVMR